MSIAKIIVFSSIFLMVIFSCKTSEKSQELDDDYLIVNEVLNAIELKYFDSIAFDPLSNNKAFVRYNLTSIEDSGLGSSCNRGKLQNYLHNFYSESFTNNLFNENIKWESSKITNPKVKVGFKLKRKKYIERYNNEKDSARVNLDFDRDYLLQLYWQRENNEPIIQVSNPIYSKKGNYSILFTRSIHYGHGVWVLNKIKKKWKVLCFNQIAI